jgi:hypothetical protein
MKISGGMPCASRLARAFDSESRPPQMKRAGLIKTRPSRPQDLYGSAIAV